MFWEKAKKIKKLEKSDEYLTGQIEELMNEVKRLKDYKYKYIRLTKGIIELHSKAEKISKE